MMNKIKTLTLLFSLLIFAGCESFLETTPQQSLPLNTAFSSPSDVRNALVGTYNRFQTNSLYGGSYIVLSELLTDNINWVGSFTQQQDIQALQMTSDNGAISGMYTNTYTLVNNANGIIEAIDAGIDGLVEAEANQLLGEALFMRGVTYFETVRFFGRPYDAATSGNDPGIPIQTLFIDDLTEVSELPRASVQAVYDQAVADLTLASTLLAESPRGNGLISRPAALAFLAEIAFQQRDYATALARCNEVISSGAFSLNSDPLTFYRNEFSGESIFEINMTDQDNPGVNGGLTAFFAQQALGGREDILVTDDFDAAINSLVNARQQTAIGGLTVIDTRRDTIPGTTSSLINIEVGDGGAVRRYTTKYEDGVNITDNPVVSRYAEILLMRAEAEARVNGLNQQSIDDLNSVRARSILLVDGGALVEDNSAINYLLSDFATVDDLIDAIVLERRVEMAFEGTYLHDLRRLQRPIRGGVAFDADNTVFPIPQDALDNNSLLTQNPGY